MAPRRSARLRGAAPAVEPLEEPPRKRTRGAKKLQTVEEHSETPEPQPEPEPESKHTTETVTATPKSEPMARLNQAGASTPKNTSASSSSKTPQQPQTQPRSSVKTPNTSVVPKLGLEEMHPSKVQKSTTKKPDPGLVLGFKPIEKVPGDSHPVLANTPSKKRQSTHPDEMDSLNFEFEFSCEDSKLSDEARKLMENIREDAAKIREQLKKEQKTQNDHASDRTVGDRKIVKPKPRAGRFSQAHMAQFKKMDSIAGHPSSFRARPDPGQPAAEKSLKRTISKARLDDPEKVPSTKTTSSAKTAASSTTPATPIAKRRKASLEDDASKRRPLSKDDQVANRVDSKIARPVTGALGTPQKPSIPRTTSLKPPNTTKIPAITRSPSLKSLQPPRTPQTDFRLKYQNGTPKLGNLKSILRRRQPLFSNDPVKIAAGTHIPAPTPEAARNQSPSESTKKRVDFSASTKERHSMPQTTPSKIPTTDKETTVTDIVYPTLPPMTPPNNGQDGSFTFEMSSPSIRKVSLSEKPVRRITMANRPGIPHGILNKKRQREETEDDGPKSKTDRNERIGDMRSIKRVKINPHTTPSKVNTPSPIKSRPIPQTTPRRSMAGSSIPRKPGLSLSRLSFLSRPKARR